MAPAPRPGIAASRRAPDRTRRALCLGALACLGRAGAAAAGADAAPAVVAAAIPGCRLAGRGSFSWWGFKVYDAALWVGPRGLDPARLDAEPFALELRYARDLVGSRIADASTDLMARMDAGTPEQREAWRDRMRGVFPDVRAGDTLTGVYDPAAGATRFALDGAWIGAIPGRAFARAFFAIWLSDRSEDPALRRRLIAGLEPRR